MSKDNHFQQYGYDHYLKAPQNKSRISDEEGGFMSKLKSPFVATAGLLLAGAIFAGIIVASYPSGERHQGEIPIVKADLRPVKIEPEERGGMDIPNSESTILATVGQNPSQEGTEEAENLLASSPPSQDELVTKEKAIEDAMSDSAYVSPSEEDSDEQNLLTKIEKSETTETSKAIVAGSEEQDKKTLHAAATSPETLDFVRSVMDKKDGASNPGETSSEDATNTLEVSDAPEVKEVVTSAKEKIGNPGLVTAQDETISVESEMVSEPKAQETAKNEKPLDTGAIESKSAKEASSIEPAVGSASGINVKPGGYYVQLASVPSRNGTDGEWKKLSRKFSSELKGLQYRVQEANLGARGTFYRIQAGPMSKSSAQEICQAIKANAGGCLVVKK